MSDPRPTYSAEDLKAQYRGDMFADKADNAILQALQQIKRLPDIAPGELSPEQQAVWDAVDMSVRDFHRVLEGLLIERRNEKGFRYDGR